MDDAGGERLKLIRNIFQFSICLYMFLVSIGMISMALKGMGQDFTAGLITTTSNPFVGLFIGILATSLVQSSSVTTSIVVGLVAGGGLNIPNAIPIIMGANIGTTITNTGISLAHLRRPIEFRRALAGATVHDFFNILTVSILFPLEITTHFLKSLALILTNTFALGGGLEFISPLKIITAPTANFLAKYLFFGLPWLLLIGAITLLAISLIFMVKNMKSIFLSKLKKLIDKYLFKTPWIALLLGLGFTCLMQSSSVTTSLLVPLFGTGILTLAQAYPYFLGANAGTTLTAILASLAAGNISAITIAFVHLLFNVVGISIFWPFKKLPIFLAKKFSEFAFRRRGFIFLYILVVFYGLPALIIMLGR